MEINRQYDTLLIITDDNLVYPLFTQYRQSEIRSRYSPNASSKHVLRLILNIGIICNLGAY